MSRNDKTAEDATKYTSIKEVLARPMSRKQAEEKALVRDAEPIESADEDGYKVIYEDGYMSWSPKDAFDKGYIKKSHIEDEEKRTTEQMLQEKGLNAPRLCPEDIDNTIVGEDYYVFPNTTLTICKLDLKNGFHVTGESAAVSMENFDEEIGRKVARENARDKIWALEGYLLKDKIWRNK